MVTEQRASKRNDGHEQGKKGSVDYTDPSELHEQGSNTVEEYGVPQIDRKRCVAEILQELRHDP